MTALPFSAADPETRRALQLDPSSSQAHAGVARGLSAALDHEGELSRMDLTTWHESLRLRVKSLYSTMRTLYQQIAPIGTDEPDHEACPAARQPLVHRGPRR